MNSYLNYLTPAGKKAPNSAKKKSCFNVKDRTNMVNINSSLTFSRSCERPSHYKNASKWQAWEGGFYVVCNTCTVPINPMFKVFPTVGRHRLVKVPTQGRQFYVKPRGYALIPLPRGKPLAGALFKTVL